MKPAARRHLAIDLGASSGRVIEVAVTGDRVKTLRELHRFANGPVPVPRGDGLRWVWPIESIWSGVLEGLRVAARDRTPVASIGIDSWAVDYGLVDRAGSLVAPVAAYRDPRTQAPMARLRTALGDEAIYAQTGIAFQPFNTLYQLAADAADPARRQRADCVAGRALRRREPAGELPGLFLCLALGSGLEAPSH